MLHRDPEKRDAVMIDDRHGRRLTSGVRYSTVLEQGSNTSPAGLPPGPVGPRSTGAARRVRL